MHFRLSKRAAWGGLFHGAASCRFTARSSHPVRATIKPRVIRGFEDLGLTCVAERHGDEPDNIGYARFGAERVRAMVSGALLDAVVMPDAIVLWCTNFDGASIAADIARETGIPVYDSNLVGLWYTLGLAGLGRSGARGWGRLFRSEPAGVGELPA